MKQRNFLFILSLCCCIFSSLAGENVLLDDFESGDKGWTPVNQGWVDFEIVNNPSRDAVNASDKVMKIVRKAQTQNWAGIILRDKIELSFGALKDQYRYGHVKILKTTNGNVSLKLEKNGDAGSFTNSQNYSPNGQWQEIVFDLGGAGGALYDDFFIMPDQTASIPEDITIYIDEITFKPDLNAGEIETELPGIFQLVWADEFDGPNGTGLDPTKWTYEIGNGSGGWGNKELEYYTNRTENVFMREGFLVIKAIKESYQGFNYTSGRFITRNKGDWKYGRIEARLKLPKGRGVWPAFWMMPTRSVYGGWPNSGEIDIMEFVGYDANRVYGTVHRQAGSGGNGNGNTASIAGKNDDFQVVRIDWEPGYIKWYLNDQLFHTYNNAATGSAQWPFDQEFYCILNFAVGGEWGGAQGVDESIWPQEFQIDYVRVYQKQGGTAIQQMNNEIFFVSPLPNDELKITSSSLLPSNMDIYSLTGQKQLSRKITSGISQISISYLPKGIYIITISDGVNLYSQKIIKA
jgi:beta-glucanase (GH16 family)